MITALTQFMGVAHAIPVGRAALGIYAALVAWTEGERKLVAVPAAVCQDVIAAILHANCIPFFCDVNPISGLTDQCEWQKAKDAGVKIAIVIHLYGNPADTANIRRIFPSPECLLIDDAAQALGAQTSTGTAGSEGDIGIVSFGSTKHIEIGGGALLIQNDALSLRCQRVLRRVNFVNDQVRRDAYAIFRKSYDHAHSQLTQSNKHSGFAGLLNGYEAALKVQWQDKWADPIAHQLEKYPATLDHRRRKAMLWLQGLADTDLQPVGMNIDAGCAPWRFACRWVKCSSHSQLHLLGESLRHSGLHVSHWYLPAHWWLNNHTTTAGAELLARQAIQFWLDANTSEPVIKNWISIIRERLTTISKTL